MTAKEIKYLDEKFESQRELFEAKLTHLSAKTELLIGDTNARLDTIVKQNEVRNGRLDKVEDLVREGDLMCKYIQDEKVKAGRDKDNRIMNNRWFFGAVIAIVSISLMGINYFAKNKKEKYPVEFYFQKSDSTLYIPKIYFRNTPPDTLREVSIEYFK